MRTIKIKYIIPIAILFVASCANIKQTIREPETQVPNAYWQSIDTTNIADVKWQEYFGDAFLNALIDTALNNNQELNIVLQEIEISRNEIRARKGDYLPMVNGIAGAGLDKNSSNSRDAKVDELLADNGKKIPDPLGDFVVGASATWEVDIWRKLRNAKDAAAKRYLASIEGKNFLVTQLVSEIAASYYELMALDNLLKTINDNIEIQTNALKSVKLQKESAKVTQLAVNRFEAQLLKTKNLQYDVKQKIVEAENRINFLTGRFPTKIDRNSADFFLIKIDSLSAGIPSQLLANRPDVRQAEFGLAAAKLDVKVARANFYPSFGIRANVGFNAFNPAFLIRPQSLLYNLAGDLMAPLINRNGIKALYYSANAKQLQAVFEYEQSILNSFVDVRNQLAKVENYSASFEMKSNEVRILEQSVNIANNLFNSARADYVEVLLTQEEVLEAKLEMIEVKAKLLEGKVNLYRSLGGGWK